jgi:hypothetical protein
MITQQYLQDNFDYNPNTGLFVRTKKTGTNTKIGIPLTCDKGNGYVVFSVQGKLQLAHRMAWLYVHGEIPSKNIDHINGLTTDNRISNLRIANQSQNTANSCLSKANTSGSKGVVWLKDVKKWRAGITVNYKFINLGRFNLKEDAAKAYANAAKNYFGDFANNGNLG